MLAGKRKRCNCDDKENCSCEKTFTDPDAAVGTMRNKTNMNKDLQFVCPQGHPLIWDGFHRETLDVWFKGDENLCQNYLYNFTCDKYFHKNYLENPLINSPVPHGSKLHKELKKFRKQVELNFAIESNSMDRVMRHKKLPVRGLPRVQMFGIMADTFRLIKLMINHMRDTVMPKDRDEFLNRMRIAQFTHPITA